MEYCATAPEDGPCAYFVPAFSTAVAKSFDLHLRTTEVVFETVEVRIIPDYCACGEICDYSHMDVEVVRARATEVDVNFAPLVPGHFHLCADPVSCLKEKLISQN